MAAGGAAVYHAGKSSAKGESRGSRSRTRRARVRTSSRPPPPPPPAPAPGGMSQSAIDELKQLGQLHDQGVLTDEEFAAQKAKVLNG